MNNMLFVLIMITRYVAPNAISNISQIEYDYSDYYDDIEEEAETSKKRRDANNEVEL